MTVRGGKKPWESAQSDLEAAEGAPENSGFGDLIGHSASMELKIRMRPVNIGNGPPKRGIPA